MDPTITVRPAQVKDAEAIARVHVDSWRTSYAGIIDAEHLASLSVVERAERWRTRLETPGETHIFVAETGDSQIVGFVSTGPNHNGDASYSGEIYGLYLLKAHQRQGIGRRLVQAAATALQRQGMQSLLIWVLADNPSRHFYAALGGSQVREKEIEIAAQRLREVAYGWPDTAPLVAL